MAKITIKCVDCKCPREIQFAHRALIKRCKDCQVEFNRNQARDRYRKKNGIPLDAPLITPRPKRKKKKKEVDDFLDEAVVTDAWGNIVEKTEKVVRNVTPEEEERRNKALQKLFNMIDDDSTTDDW